MTEYKALSPIQAIQTRPGMYVGDVDTPNQLVVEVVDNALDELANNHANICQLYFDIENNYCWISDNGRGIKSYQMQDANGNYEDSVVLLCTASHSGSKFDNEDYQTLIGMHGVGLTVVNALSNWLIIKTRDRKDKSLIYEYTFQNSVLYSRKKYNDESEIDQWSTVIGFEPNPKYFDSKGFILKTFVERLMLAQAKFSNCDFYFNNKQLTKRSFLDYVQKTLQINEKFKVIKYQKSNNEKIELYINYQENQNINIVGDVNLRKCEGTYITSIQTTIKNILQEKLGNKFKNVNSNLFLMGLNLYISVTIPEPKFDSQSKIRMTLNVRDLLIIPIKEKINNALDNEILEKIKNNIENKLQKKFITTKNNKRIRVSASNKLKDCINTPGEILYIVEGDSALAPLKQIRNIKTQAIYPVKGKVLNVEKSGMDKIQKNKEIIDLIEAMGQKDKRRYQKIKILADADCDGRHISVLILLVLLKFGEDFIKENKVSVILPPLYGATKGKQFIPIYNHDDLPKYHDYSIMRFKGLGEMSPKQLKASIDSEVEYVVQYPNDNKQLEILLNIIKDTNYKQQMLRKKEFNFNALLNNVLTTKKGE